MASSRMGQQHTEKWQCCKNSLMSALFHKVSGLQDFWTCHHLTRISGVEMVRVSLVGYVDGMGQTNSYRSFVEISLQYGHLKSRNV